jgi:hypothetical protein
LGNPEAHIVLFPLDELGLMVPNPESQFDGVKNEGENGTCWRREEYGLINFINRGYRDLIRYGHQYNTPTQSVAQSDRPNGQDREASARLFVANWPSPNPVGFYAECFKPG